MIKDLFPLALCAEISGLSASELVLGVSPGREHDNLLLRYLGRRLRPNALRAAIVGDIRAAAAMGAGRRAADLLIVLRRLLANEAERNVGARRRAKQRAAAVFRVHAGIARAAHPTDRRPAPIGRKPVENGDNVLSLDAYRERRRG